MGVVRFNSIEEFLEYLDKEVEKLRSSIEELEGRVHGLKEKAEIGEKIEGILKGLIPGYDDRGRELRVGEVKILLNPQPREELVELERIVEATILKLKKLESIGESLSPFKAVRGERISVEVIEYNGIPGTIIIKI